MPHRNPPLHHSQHSLPKAEGALGQVSHGIFGFHPKHQRGTENYLQAGTEFQVPGFYCAVSRGPVSTGMHPHTLGISRSPQFKSSNRLTERTSSIHLHFH